MSIRQLNGVIFQSSDQVILMVDLLTIRKLQTLNWPTITRWINAMHRT